ATLDTEVLVTSAPMPGVGVAVGVAVGVGGGLPRLVDHRHKTPCVAVPSVILQSQEEHLAGVTPVLQPKNAPGISGFGQSLFVLQIGASLAPANTLPAVPLQDCWLA